MSGWSSGTDRIASALRALRERGQSETLGVALLTGIVVILVAVTGLFLFADFGADDEEQLLATVQGDVAASNITLEHQAGDTFEPENIEIVLSGDANKEYTLDEFSEVDGASGEFAPGDRWFTDTDTIVGSGRLLVIHEPTNTVLLDQGYNVQADEFALRLESLPDRELSAGTATVYGDSGGEQWDFELSMLLGGASRVNPDQDNINYSLEISDPTGPLDRSDIELVNNSNTDEYYINITKDLSAGQEAEFTFEATLRNSSSAVDVTVKPSSNFNVVDMSAGPAPSPTPNGVGGFSTGALQSGPPKVGDLLEFSVTIENTGGAEETRPIKMSIEGPSKGYVYTETVPMTLGSGEQDTVEITDAIPTEYGPGEYEFKVDAGDMTDSINRIVRAEALYDVEAVNVNGSLSVPNASGTTISIDYNVTNTGGTLNNDSQPVQLSVTALNPDGTTQVTETDAAPIGKLNASNSSTGTLSVDTDPFGAGIAFANLSTEDDYTTFVVGLLEFEIVDFDFNDIDLDSESTFDPSVKIESDFATPLQEPIDTELEFDPGSLGNNKTETVSFDRGDESVTKTVDFSSIDLSGETFGLYPLSVEETVTGESATTQLELLGTKVGVTIDDFQTQLDPGTNLEVDYTVTNLGNKPVSGDVVLQSGSGFIAEQKTFNLNSQDDEKSGELEFPYDQINPGEDFSFEVKAINYGGSNSSNGTTTLLEPAFFDVNITNADSSIAQGDNIDVQADVTNTGGKTATQSIVLSLKDSGGTIIKSDTKQVANLDGGDSQPVSLKITDTDSLSAGAYDLVVESDNDTATATLEVASFSVDIQESSVPDNPLQGATLQIPVTVENLGNGRATTELTVEEDNLGSNSTTIDTATSETVTLSLEIPVSQGGNSLTVEAIESATGATDSYSISSVRKETLSFTIDATDGNGNGESVQKSAQVVASGYSGLTTSASGSVSPSLAGTGVAPDSPADATPSPEGISTSVNSADATSGTAVASADGTATTSDVSTDAQGWINKTGGSKISSVDATNYDYVDIVVVGAGGGGGAHDTNDGDVGYGASGGNGGRVVARGVDVSDVDTLNTHVGEGGDFGDANAGVGGGEQGQSAWGIENKFSGDGDYNDGAASGGGGGGSGIESAETGWIAVAGGGGGGGAWDVWTGGTADIVTGGGGSPGGPAGVVIENRAYLGGGKTGDDALGTALGAKTADGGQGGSVGAPPNDITYAKAGNGGGAAVDDALADSFDLEAGEGADGGNGNFYSDSRGEGYTGEDGKVAVKPLVVDGDVYVSATAPSQIAPSDNLQVDYTLHNDGEREVTVSFVQFYVDGTSRGSQSGKTVPAGGTKTGSFSYSGSYSSGYQLSWRVELSDSGYSWHDDQSSGTTNVVEPGNLDLTVVDAPSEVTPGTDLTIQYNVKNTGGKTVSTDLDLYVDKKSSRVTFDSISLDGGEEAAGTLSWDWSNDYSTGETINWNLELRNNQGAVSDTTDVVEPGDLDLTVTSAPSEIKTSDPLSIGYKIENVGGKTVSTDLELTVDQASGLADSTSVSLGGGGLTQGSLVFDDVSNKYSAGGTITWTLELANGGGSKQGTTNVTGTPDFDVTIQSYPDPVEIGGNFPVSYKIANNGGGAGTVNVELVIDGQVEDGTDHVIPAGDSVSSTLVYGNVTLSEISSVRVVASADD